MSRFACRPLLRVEQLEGRVTPASLEPAPVLNAGPAEVRVAPDLIKGEEAAPANSAGNVAQIDELPLRVSLTAVIVIALGVGWDRRTREGRTEFRNRTSRLGLST